MPILLQINTVANSGSTGRIAESIAEAMKEENWICYTAYGRWANSSITHLLRVGTKWDNYSHYLFSQLFDMHGLASLNATKQLVSEIRKIKPDLIHLHNLHGYYINYPYLFKFLSNINIPIVWTLHDCWPYTGHCVHYTNVGCGKWKKECNDCPNLSDYPAALFCDHSRRNYLLKKQFFTSHGNLTIVTVSQWLANEVQQSFLKNYPIKVIHNGVDVDVFHFTESKVRLKYKIEGKFVILGVATVWNTRKGLSDFIKLSKRLPSEYVIVLVGLNNKQISKLPSNIIGLRNTENTKDLVMLYSAADLFVNFSTEETFGLTTAESMACGTPVLVYNSTACSEIVTKNTGFIINPHDINKAISIIKYVKSVGKESYSENCSSYIHKNLDKDYICTQYASLYKELLSKRK